MIYDLTRRFIQLTILFYSIASFSQDGLNLSLNSVYASTADAVYVKDKYAYVIGNTFDTTKIAVLVGKFYKINLETNIIEDSIEINSNPIEFDTRSTKLANINDTLHYFTYGEEWRDTMIDNQNVYTYYHHFKYSLSDGVWSNQTFPAYNEVGRQFLANKDAYISDSSIYLVGITTDFEINDADILLTKLDHHGKVIWNIELEYEIFHSVWRILENRKKEIIVSGLISDIAPDRRSGYRHPYLIKINAISGEVIKKFVLEQDSDIPKSLIEDPSGGYIIGAGNAEFQEGAVFPAITRIIKINEDLDSVEWEIELSDTLSYNFLWHLDNFTSLGNNEFLAVGVSDMIKPFSHDGRIVKFTGDGKLIFDKEIQHFSPRDDLEQRLTDVFPYKDGFIACGTVFAHTSDFIIPRQQGWIVYIDKNGNADISSTTSELEANDDGTVHVFPNPSNGNFTIEFNENIEEDLNYEIHTINGIKIQSDLISKGSKQHTVNMQASSIGVHVLSLYTSDRKVSKLLFLE